MTKTVDASVFGPSCLSLLDAVVLSREPIVITQNGNPVAEPHPCPARRSSSLAPRAASPWALGGIVEVYGDIIDPIGRDLWDALE
jgi:hypothetical protein